MTKIQLRRDTAANWSANNPTPSAGEPCFETDTGKLKIGDGATAYNNLAYQGGGDSLVKFVDNNFSVSSTGELSLANAISVGTSVTAGTIIGSTAVGAPALRLGSYAGMPVRPEITYTATDGMKINARALEASGNIMKPVTVIASEFKSGDNTTQYEVVNKSPANNTYMAHMAMPSDKYIDLELGASGTAYTAPADGWAVAYDFVVQTNTILSIFRAQELHLGMRISRPTSRSYADCYIPCSKGETFRVEYGDQTGNANTPKLRFYYAKGSEPTE